MPPESLLVFSAYAVSQKLSEAEALQKGMEAKAVEFVKQSAEVYKKL